MYHLHHFDWTVEHQKLQFWVIWVVKFPREGYKIREIFCPKHTIMKYCIYYSADLSKIGHYLGILQKLKLSKKSNLRLKRRSPNLISQIEVRIRKAKKTFKVRFCHFLNIDKTQ